MTATPKPKAKPLPEGVTEAMQKALHWLKEHFDESNTNSAPWVRRRSHSGEYQTVLVGGEIGPFHENTWNKLLKGAYLRLEAGRVHITFKGHKFIVNHPLVKGFVSHNAPSSRWIDPAPGAE